MRKMMIVAATLLVAGAAVFLGGRFGHTNASDQTQSMTGSPLGLMSGATDLPVQSFDAF